MDVEARILKPSQQGMKYRIDLYGEEPRVLRHRTQDRPCRATGTGPELYDGSRRADGGPLDDPLLHETRAWDDGCDFTRMFEKTTQEEQVAVQRRAQLVELGGGGVGAPRV